MNQVAAKKLASKGPIIDPKLVLKPVSGAVSDNTIGNTKYPERKGVFFSRNTAQLEAETSVGIAI